MAIVDDVAEAIDASIQERDELEQMLSQDPAAFLAEYGRYLTEEDRKLLSGRD